MASMARKGSRSGTHTLWTTLPAFDRRRVERQIALRRMTVSDYVREALIEKLAKDDPVGDVPPQARGTEGRG